MNKFYMLCTLQAFISSRSASSNVGRVISSPLMKTVLHKFPELESILADIDYVEKLRSKYQHHLNIFSSENKEEISQQFERFYLPTYLHVKNLMATSYNASPYYFGLSAPQGCGKTTFTSIIQALFEEDGLNCVSMSIDDFYLTGQEQEEIASRYPDNNLLQYRGNAGTHDLKLALNTLRDFQKLKNSTRSQVDLQGASSVEEYNRVVLVPQYNKSLREGRGDRADLSKWLKIDKPVDVVLFEGWMLGFSPFDPIDEKVKIQLEKDKNSEKIKQINEILKGYSELDKIMDAWLVLAVDNPNYVFSWRLQAEKAMRQKGLAGLSDKQVEDFVARFMPAYEYYLPSLYKNGPLSRKITNDKPASVLKVSVDKYRKPIASEFLN